MDSIEVTVDRSTVNIPRQGRIQRGGGGWERPPLDALTFTKKVEKGKKKLANSGSAPPP